MKYDHLTQCFWIFSSDKMISCWLLLREKSCVATPPAGTWVSCFECWLVKLFIYNMLPYRSAWLNSNQQGWKWTFLGPGARAAGQRRLVVQRMEEVRRRQAESYRLAYRSRGLCRKGQAFIPWTFNSILQPAPRPQFPSNLMNLFIWAVCPSVHSFIYFCL